MHATKTDCPALNPNVPDASEALKNVALPGLTNNGDGLAKLLTLTSHADALELFTAKHSPPAINAAKHKIKNFILK